MYILELLNLMPQMYRSLLEAVCLRKYRTVSTNLVPPALENRNILFVCVSMFPQWYDMNSEWAWDFNNPGSNPGHGKARL